jgi:RNA recognition motif-containing protein
LHRYAFLHYANAEEAANVVKNADNFKINNHPLIISFYDKMKTKLAKREKLSYVIDH